MRFGQVANAMAEQLLPNYLLLYVSVRILYQKSLTERPVQRPATEARNHVGIDNTYIYVYYENDLSSDV
jgi:hypothetical protein